MSYDWQQVAKIIAHRYDEEALDKEENATRRQGNALAVLVVLGVIGVLILCLING